MRKQTCFVIGILIGVLLMIAILECGVVYADDNKYSNNDQAFGEPDETFNEETYDYHEIKIDGTIYRCKTYEIKGGSIIMKNVFMEGNKENRSAKIEMGKNELEYIKEKTSISEDEVIKENKSDCFINTAQDDYSKNHLIGIVVVFISLFWFSILHKIYRREKA